MIDFETARRILVNAPLRFYNGLKVSLRAQCTDSVRFDALVRQLDGSV